MPFCRKCGIELNEDYLFCNRCGAKQIINEKKLVPLMAKPMERPSQQHYHPYYQYRPPRPLSKQSTSKWIIPTIIIIVIIIIAGIISYPRKPEKNEEEEPINSGSYFNAEIIGFKYEIKYKSSGMPEYIKIYMKFHYENVYSIMININTFFYLKEFGEDWYDNYKVLSIYPGGEKSEHDYSGYRITTIFIDCNCFFQTYYEDYLNATPSKITVEIEYGNFEILLRRALSYPDEIYIPSRYYEYIDLNPGEIVGKM